MIVFCTTTPFVALASIIDTPRLHAQLRLGASRFPAVYTSEHATTAILENLLHVSPSARPKIYLLAGANNRRKMAQKGLVQSVGSKQGAARPLGLAERR